MNDKKKTIFTISFSGNEDNNIDKFMQNLTKLENQELDEWMTLFNNSNAFLLLGQKYVYATNFKFSNSLGCSFFIKEINSTDPNNCIIGGCNPKIGLIVYNIYCRALSSVHTLELLENNEDIETKYSDFNGLIIRDLRPTLINKDPRDQKTELILLQQELEQQLSRILSLSVSPTKNKLMEFYDSMYSMIPAELIEKFNSIQTQ